MFQRLKNAWKLFKATLAYIKKDKSLLAVPILLPFANLAVLLLFVIPMIIAFVSGAITEQNQITFVAINVLLLFCIYLVNTFLGAAQSWMVFEVAKGKDATLKSGLRRAWHNIMDVIWFAVVMTVIRLLTQLLRGRDQQGIAGMLRRMLASTIEGIVGILGKLVLPAMIVTDKTFKEAVVDLRQSVKAWPEILAFEFGVGPLFTLVFFVAAAVLGLFSFALSALIGSSIAIIVFVISLVLVIVMLSILSKAVDATYYTLLYLALVEKKHLKNIDDVFHTKF